MTKIAVYAICKNEIENIADWLYSVSAADTIVVADTGSNDGTIEKFHESGVEVSRISVDPWRFDRARNLALDLIPDDVDWCISVDLDERLTSDWRNLIDPFLVNSHRLVTKLWDQYRGISSGCLYSVSRIHRRFGYRWCYRCHESLRATQAENVLTLDVNIFNHQSIQKPSRSGYLDLLEEDHREDPLDLRTAYYLGRQLVRSDRLRARELLYAAAKNSLRRYESLLYVCKTFHSNEDQRLQCLNYLCDIDPSRREAWVELAKFYYAKNDLQQAIKCYQKANNLKSRYGMESRDIYWNQDFKNLGKFLEDRQKD